MKHRKTVVLLVAGILGAGTMAACSVEEPSSADTKAGKTGNHKTKGVVGQTVKNAGTEYTVTKVRTTKTLGDQEYGLGSKANGTFVVVDLKITNRKNETKTFMDGSAKLVTKDGNAYESSTEASMSLKDDLMLEEIQPDLTTKGSIGYDVPESKVAGSKLVIEDIWGNGEVKINLGL